MKLQVTVGIIVTFHPSKETLVRLVSELSKQLSFVVVVDNGSADSLVKWCCDFSNTHVICLGENLGIAAAQNIGIQWAKEKSAEYVVLFDQDSDLLPNTIPSLMRVMQGLQSSGKNVACVGPRYIDKRQNNPSPFIRIEGIRLVRESCKDISDVVPVDHLIASGSLIPMNTLEEVGPMAESLFIDYVDLEWCERAKFSGYQTYGVCAAQMEHALGDGPIPFFGKFYPARSPLRHYYMCRNAIWIYRQSYVRWNWKVVDALRLLRKYIFYSLFAKPGHVHFWMMTKGVWHGLIGKMGRYDSSQP